MTFRKDYQALEGQFKERVKADNELFGWRGKNRSRYLPNVVPKGKVDFVLVAMEPSSNAWDKDGNLLTPRDFHFSGEDFVLHYCLRYYLCADGLTYHVTDLAKGAMKTELAAKGR